MSDLELKPSDDGGDGDDALQRLIDHLYEYLTCPDPCSTENGPELVLRLEPNEFSDDPRILELLELLTAAGLEVRAPAADSEPESAVGALHDGHQLHDVTDAVKAEFGPKMEAQTREAMQAREAGEPPSVSVGEEIELREEFKAAVGALNRFVNAMAGECARRFRGGCSWWGSRVPQPVRTVLESAAAGGGVNLLSASPMIGLVVAVSVVALVSRRAR